MDATEKKWSSLEEETLHQLVSELRDEDNRMTFIKWNIVADKLSDKFDSKRNGRYHSFSLVNIISTSQNVLQ